MATLLSDILLNIGLETDMATQDELCSSVSSVIGLDTDSEDALTLHGLAKRGTALAQAVESETEAREEADALLEDKIGSVSAIAGNAISAITMNDGEQASVEDGVANLGTVLTAHQPLDAYALNETVDALSGEVVDGLSNEVVPKLSTIADLTEEEVARVDKISADLSAHIRATDNPHGVTGQQVGILDSDGKILAGLVGSSSIANGSIAPEKLDRAYLPLSDYIPAPADISVLKSQKWIDSDGSQGAALSIDASSSDVSAMKAILMKKASSTSISSIVAVKTMEASDGNEYQYIVASTYGSGNYVEDDFQPYGDGIPWKYRDLGFGEWSDPRSPALPPILTTDFIGPYTINAAGSQFTGLIQSNEAGIPPLPPRSTINLGYIPKSWAIELGYNDINDYSTYDIQKFRLTSYTQNYDLTAGIPYRDIRVTESEYQYFQDDEALGRLSTELSPPLTSGEGWVLGHLTSNIKITFEYHAQGQDEFDTYQYTGNGIQVYGQAYENSKTVKTEKRSTLIDEDSLAVVSSNLISRIDSNYESLTSEVDQALQYAGNAYAEAQNLHTVKADKTALKEVSDSLSNYLSASLSVNFVPWTKDDNNDRTAVTVGTRAVIVGPSAKIGQNSFVVGTKNHAAGTNSVACGLSVHTIGDNAAGFGRESQASGEGSFVAGYKANSFIQPEGQSSIPHKYAFVWQGKDTGAQYSSHGDGTFNINPVDGLSGFYISEHTFPDAIRSVANDSYVQKLQLKNKLSTGLSQTVLFDDSASDTDKISALIKNVNVLQNTLSSILSSL